ncbi:MAG TPA: hypothetical protein VGD95_02295 [Micavibrio sp.]
MDISAGIAAQAAITRQTMAISMVKQAADMEKQLVAMLDAAISNVPVSSTRGAALNITA